MLRRNIEVNAKHCPEINNKVDINKLKLFFIDILTIYIFYIILCYYIKMKSIKCNSFITLSILYLNNF
jgi:hypothetical protein